MPTTGTVTPDLETGHQQLDAPTWNNELRWNDITYEINAGKPGARQILKTLSGSVKSGEMVAIMGSSGAGKTTLLNCLSGRLNTGHLSGAITYNGQLRDPRSWRKTMAFVEQDDCLYSNITVRETLRFAARLRLPSKEFSVAEKHAKADEILKRLRLSRAADTPIGDGATRGVSGGERKRTAIGQELVGNPQILFLDEPTSGLDSNSALAVMENVKNDAQATGRIVVATIHQPSFELLLQFDRLVLLSGGSTVYLGPPSHAADYFAALGYPIKRAGVNPADHFMDLLTIDTSRTEEATKADIARIDFLHRAYSENRAKIERGGFASPVVVKALDNLETVEEQLEREDKENARILSDPAALAAATAAGKDLTPRLEWANAWGVEMWVLLQRQWLEFSRARIQMIAQGISTAILIILIGFTFFRVKNDQKSIQNRLGILFFWPVNNVFNTMMPILAVFPLGRIIMLRERATGAYRVSSFFLANVLVQMIPTGITSIIASVCLYYMIGLQTTDGIVPMLRFVLIQWVEVMVCVAVGFLIGAAVPSIQLAQVVGPLMGVIFLLYGGTLLNNDDLPYVFRGFQYISPVNYAYRANMFNEFQSLELACSPDPNLPCFKTGEQVLKQYSLADYTLWTCVGILGCLFTGYLALGYLTLRFVGKPKVKLV
ncbi:ATP-binding cassette sub- G member 2 [Phlyctochytrium bullatum]|nr:ATP-binding cassette sub- G member 2 [Phlyctochytrium bullatum]